MEKPSNQYESSCVSACTGFIAMPKFHTEIIIGTWTIIDLIKKPFPKGKFENSKYKFFFFF